MILKDIVQVDFLNYKEPAMYVAFPYCTFKCERECGIECCHNSSLAKARNIDVTTDRVIELYAQAHDISKNLVLCGLEPLDSFADVIELISRFRETYDDTVIIYTGYTEDEASTYIDALKNFPNIIVKFGRFIPGQPHHVDEVLGVSLASPNQYAKKIS